MISSKAAADMIIMSTISPPFSRCIICTLGHHKTLHLVPRRALELRDELEISFPESGGQDHFDFGCV